MRFEMNERNNPVRGPRHRLMLAGIAYTALSLTAPRITDAQQPTSSSPATTTRTTISTGTGFVVSEEGLLLTAYHVVEAATSLQVKCPGLDAQPVSVSAKSPTVDLAVLRVRGTPRFKEYLPLAAGASGSIGERVFTVGYPVPGILGLDPKYTEGTISSMAGLQGDATFFQISVPVQPGNSGGPLVDDSGTVIGVIVSGAAAAAFMKQTGALPQNINWAVKATNAVSLLSAEKSVPSKHKSTKDRAALIQRVTAASCLIVATRPTLQTVPATSSAGAGSSRATAAPREIRPSDSNGDFSGWMSGNEYQSLWNNRKGSGFRPSVIEGRVNNGREEFRARWEPFSSACAFTSHRAMTKAVYESQNGQFIQNGYSVVVTQFNNLAGVPAYNAVWTKGCEPNRTSSPPRGSTAPIEAPREIKPESAGTPNGPVGGVIGGVVGGLPSSPPPPPLPPAPIRVGGATSAPVKIKDVRPVYPQIAQSARVQGTVLIEATIGVRGDVTDTKILKSSPLLDAAALDAVRQWQFTPTFLNGIAVPVIMTVTVTFSLADDSVAIDRNCSAGKLEECRRLAIMLRSGTDVAQDLKRARELFQRACDGDISSACQSLASMYVAGEGGAIDLSNAARIDRKACEANDSAACTALARLTYTGKGVAKNVQEAIGLYERAIGASQRGCEGRDMASCTDLTFIADLYQTGREAPRNVERAIAMYRSACDKRGTAACAMLGTAVSTGSGVPKDLAAGAVLFQQACPANIGFTPEDPERAAMIYAARARACGSLGEFYEKGNGVPVSQSQAITLYQRACTAQQFKGIDLSRLPDRCADVTRLQVKLQGLPFEDR
jgi:TonB family protein